jgi:hypothetical protein
MGLIVYHLIYHKGELFTHVLAEAKHDPSLGSYVGVNINQQQLSYGMLERVPNGSSPYPIHVKCETNDPQ